MLRGLGDISDVYSLDELFLSVERMYAGLLKYIDGGKAPKLEKYFLEYREEFEE